MREHGKKCGKDHGLSKTRIYKTWCDVHSRCENPKNTFYHNYGGRGITVCPEWHDFIPFYEWAMASGYNDMLTIERLNNATGYMPENCRFVDRFVQANNKRNNRIFHVMGEDITLAQITRKYNLTKKTVYDRYNKGMRGDALVAPKYHYQDGGRENKRKKAELRDRAKWTIGEPVAMQAVA